MQVATHTPGRTGPVDTQSSTPARDRAFDILKGLSILEVVIHHVLSFSMRKYATPGAWDWWALAAANRILHFAVPTFLLVSALLLARSIAAKHRPDWRRFYRRRVLRTLLPYAVWTVLYMAFRLLVVRADTDLRPVPTAYPLIGSGDVPQLFAWDRILSVILAGKAYFHLYFMVVMLHLAIAFPLLLAGIRRLQGGFGVALGVGISLQLAAFLLQARVLKWAFPASTLLWYLLPVCLGLWLGIHWSEWREIWARWRWAAAVLATTGFGIYFPMEMRLLMGAPVYGLAYNLGAIAYATGIALLLLALSTRMATTPRLGPLFARIGDWSLPIFLIHPLALYFVGGPTLTAMIARLPFPALWVFCGVAGMTWALSALGMRERRTRRILFGR